MTRKQQAGVTTVEFAIIGLLAMTCLLAVIEFSRMVFTLNTLSEATRRGARMAAVCPINDPAIVNVALFDTPAGGTGVPPISRFGAGNIVVEYLDDAGAVVGSPGANFMQIGYVRVRIANYQHRLLIPLFDLTFNVPAYPSTLPRESLGVPRVGTGPLPC